MNYNKQSLKIGALFILFFLISVTFIEQINIFLPKNIMTIFLVIIFLAPIFGVAFFINYLYVFYLKGR